MGDVTSYSHLFVKGIRYGAASHHQGRSSKYAYIYGREAVEIQHIFKITQECSNPADGSLKEVCAIVKRFQTDNGVPCFPWDLRYMHLMSQFIMFLTVFRAVDLGVNAWHAEWLGDYEVVTVQDLTGNPIICPLTVRGSAYWITVAFNHVCCISFTVYDFLLSFQITTETDAGGDYEYEESI